MARKKGDITKSFTFEGKRYYFSAATEAEAIEKMVLRRKALEDGEKKIEKNMSVKSWSREWIRAYKEPSVSTATLRNYATRLDKHILPTIGGLPLSAVRPLHCQQIINSMVGYSRDQLSKVANTMYQLFDKALKNNLMVVNPAADIELPKATDNTRRAITDQERKAILAVADYHKAGLWVKLMIYCGLRTGETTRVKICHLDPKRNTLFIDGTKTDAAKRTVPVPPEIAAEIEAMKKDPFDYLFTNQRGEPLTKNNCVTMWRSFKREMNIHLGCKVYRNEVIPPYRVADDLVPYCLRHTFCTDMQDAGVPINIAKDLMGHTNISVTAKIYTHRTEASIQSAADLLQAHRVVPPVVPSSESIEK